MPRIPELYEAPSLPQGDIFDRTHRNLEYVSYNTILPYCAADTWHMLDRSLIDTPQIPFDRYLMLREVRRRFWLPG